MKKKAFIPFLCLPTFLHLRNLIIFYLQFEEESDFLHAVATQAGQGQKFQSNLRRKQIFVLFNDCQDMLQDVDEIISQPFPVN